MPQDAPGRKHQDPWEPVVHVTVGLPDNSTDALISADFVTASTLTFAAHHPFLTARGTCG